MKALNNREINKKYLLFLLNFTVLLTVTVMCYFMYLKADQQQSRMIVEKQKEHEYIFTKRREMEQKIDSLHMYLNMLNTEQVENEAELERRIGNLKNEASQQLERLKANGDPTPFRLFEKILSSIDHARNNKHTLREIIAEEADKQQLLDECMKADARTAKQLRNVK